MSAVEAFHLVWVQARNTLGNGAPQRGEDFDRSGELTDLAQTVDTAAPRDQWAGGAAIAYARANSEQRQVLTRLAELDRKIAWHVNASADVVTAGRQNLDSVRDWVNAAVGSVPPGRLRETMLMQIANKGLAELSEIIEKTNGDANAIAESLRRLGPEFDEIRRSLRFGDVKESPEDTLPGEESEEGSEPEWDKTDLSSGDIEAIDEANRELLQRMKAEYQQLPDGKVKQDRLADIAAIEAALDEEGSHLLYLERPDDPSKMTPAATVIGDPFTADHVSVAVPGVGSATRHAIDNMTREARDLKREADNVARAVNMQTTTATIAWTGYDPPPELKDPSAWVDDRAQAGASDLTSFLRELDAASRNPNQTVALFGHSYGSLTSGIALREGASAYVDNAVMYGSPGFQVTKPADLGMTDNNFYVMTTPDDPIKSVSRLAPLHGWGADPNEVIREGGQSRYRFEHLETDGGLTPIPGYEEKMGASGHSEYPRDATRRMTGYNLAVILLNRPDLAVREFPE